MFFNRVDNRIQDGKSFLVESTLAGRGFGRLLQRLKTHHYTVTIIFVFLESPNTCIARVHERVRKGGHTVSESDIMRRFYRSINNFWNQYRYQVDSWHLIDNSTSRLKVVAFGKAREITVLDEALLEIFIRNIDNRQGGTK